MKKNIYIITLILLILDQLIKYAVTSGLTLHQEVVLIPGFFSLQYAQNTGAAWSLLEGNVFLLIVISVVAVIALNQYLLHETKFSKCSIWAYGLIMGGILGNLVDRLIHEYVIDYLSFQIFEYHFPIFNLADTAIVIGIVLLIIDIVRSEIYDRRKRRQSSMTRSVSSAKIRNQS